jgi:hypothetical protein
MPPRKVPQNFATTDITPEFSNALIKANLKIIKISDYLYFKKIPQIKDNYALPDEALNLFQDSTMLNLLRDN